uniref:Uncharacterized protein n=1 Tax=Periophthalmus magnuspinnatus TaxID=409849 RepID=A0A3B4BIS8_9GOBI
MHSKQKFLVERVDALDEENEQLQRQLAESEEKQSELHGQIRQMSEKREQLQATLDQQQDSCVKLQKDKETLSTKISNLANTVAELKQHIKACAERERLLVAFPDLNPQTQPQSTGNVTLDMEEQFKANCCRIQVLEQENSTLHRSLLKLKEKAELNKVTVSCVINCTMQMFEGRSGRIQKHHRSHPDNKSITQNIHRHQCANFSSSKSRLNNTSCSLYILCHIYLV